MATGSFAPRADLTVLQQLVFLVLIAVSGCLGEAEVLDIGGCPLITGGNPPDHRVRVFLYTPLNPLEPQHIDYGAVTSNLSRSFFNASRTTKVMVHGYNSDMGIFHGMMREYLRRGDYNLFLIDWAELTRSPCYITAAHDTRFVGRCLAELVQRMRDAGATDIHLIGFSLGAHVPAFAANHLRPNLLPRITGLDPAMPLFVTADKDQKLDSGDAKFVDVIHTNSFMQGKSERCGHVDFYMNGGITQPGCSGDSGCNHHRAVQYFSESIRSAKGFWGWPCGGFFNYVIGLCPPRGTPRLLGEDVDRRSDGFYVTKTNAASPYAQGPWRPAETERQRHRYATTSPRHDGSAASTPAPLLNDLKARL